MESEPIKVRLTGAFYQPRGCDTAIVTGIVWSKQFGRPTISLVYTNGYTDYIPLSELGVAHPLGNVIILNH